MNKQHWRLIVPDNNIYFNSVLDIIKKALRGQQEKIDATEKQYTSTNDYDDSYTGYTLQDYLGDIMQDHWHTKQILYKSFVISIFMFMESKLLELCEYLRKKHKQNFSANDLRGTGATNAIYYIKKVIDVNFPKNPEVNEQFKIAQKVRNILVHVDGKILDNDKRKQFNDKVVARSDGKIEITNNEIEFSEQYLKDLVLLNEKICDEVSQNWTGVGNDWLKN